MEEGRTCGGQATARHKTTQSVVSSAQPVLRSDAAACSHVVSQVARGGQRNRTCTRTGPRRRSVAPWELLHAMQGSGVCCPARHRKTTTPAHAKPATTSSLCEIKGWQQQQRGRAASFSGWRAHAGPRKLTKRGDCVSRCVKTQINVWVQRGDWGTRRPRLRSHSPRNRVTSCYESNARITRREQNHDRAYVIR